MVCMKIPVHEFSKCLVTKGAVITLGPADRGQRNRWGWGGSGASAAGLLAAESYLSQVG